MMKSLKVLLFSTLYICLALPITAQSAVNALAANPVSRSKSRTIAKVDPIQVETPVGTAPRLPWQVWVTYSDGSHEWRQTKWMNFQISEEKQEADPALNPVGKTYMVNGFIIGDNTTDEGYPIKAKVMVTAKEWASPAPKPIARTLSLKEVKLQGTNRLTHNQSADIQALLPFDITQMLYNYRDTYGLSTEGYKQSEGWDSPTTKLKGHGSGHYMSALAMAYASTINEGQKDALRERIRRMVNELRECQERTFVWDSTLNRYYEARDYAPEEELKQMKGDWKAFDEYKKDYRHYGYGYLNAIPAAHPVLVENYRPYNNEDWVWAPYYTIHKQLAGLIDIANCLDDEEIASKALLIAKDMGLWVWNRLHYRTYVKAEGDEAERQAKPGNRYEMWNMYIAGEVGGMAESLARLAEMTDNATERAHLLEAANAFDSPAFFDPVAKNVDDIRNRHANQHIPMIIGALRSYQSNGNAYYYHLADNFWNLVQGRYIYAMGGVGNAEMFREPYTQILSMNTNTRKDHQQNQFPDPNLNETCCAYNLAKLTKDLNCFDPDKAEYMDYYERVLYNQIVGSVHPDHWAVTYHYGVGMNAAKPFGNENPQFSCCGGTGVENHVKYQEATYFVNDKTLWVGLYLPTIAQWEDKGVTIEQNCEWPAERSELVIHRTDPTKAATFALKLRVPYWATKGFMVKLNGKPIAKKYQPCSYVEIPMRQWKEGDKIEVTMPFRSHIHWGADKMEVAATGKNEVATKFEPQWVGAIMYGPLVMATSNVKEWKDADATLQSNLSDIHLNGAKLDSKYGDNLFTLSLGDMQFLPDYYVTGHATHYLRLRPIADRKESSDHHQHR